MAAEKTKRIYFFKPGKADGRADMKALLGGKGANLAEMSNVGLPVPPGFTITTESCRDYYTSGKKWPAGLPQELDENVAMLEKATGRKLGDAQKPLLVSVRSGAAVSMPGMMDTILNLGMNDKSVQGLAAESGDERFAWDCYRRFIQMFGNVAMFVPHRFFDDVLARERKKAGVKFDSQLTADQLREIVDEFKAIYKKNTGEVFPADPKQQLRRAIDAVFGSWNNPQAIRYREIHEIRGLLGTAVNVQTMVFGNMGHTSFTGVGFTRNPATGQNKLYGEYLVNAQGEDVVAGIRTPKSVDEMSNEDLSDFDDADVPADEARTLYARMYEQLLGVKKTLEEHYTDMQDFEFTAQQGTLYMLQTRTGKRTAMAAVQIAVDLKAEGLIDKKTAIMRVEPNQIEQLLHKQFDPKAKKKAEADGRALAVGLPASPGAAVGKIALTADDAEALAAAEAARPDGMGVILVRDETSPEDIGGMHVSVGILTARGGMTSHAAVVARGMGTCCVAGCGAVHPDDVKKQVTIAGKKFKEGDVISLDGTTGQVFDGVIDVTDPEMSGAFGTLMEWAEEFRTMGVWANADTPNDARQALAFGAEGIGLCRTEHMFFEEGRISYVRQMMLAAPEVRRLNAVLAGAETAASQTAGEEKKALMQRVRQVKADLKEKRAVYDAALKKLLPEQRKDFEGIFKAMDGLPVVVRLLDPPLHEFLPHERDVQARLGERMGLTADEVAARVSQLRELNPMLGHRGCRLGLTYPDVYNMQVRAIIQAAVRCKKKGIDVHPEIMIPLVGTDEELRICREAADTICREVLEKAEVKIDYKIGTMIEVPRAALTADQVAQYADFFSFGTNDLTQMAYGFSRDDVGTFVPEYVEREILANDPFQVLDQTGVGQLVEMGVTRGRATKPNLKIGICGEHGGEPRSVKFCHRVGMNYVSCSPFRVPVARLAAAQAAVETSK
ncbi:MAG: pyruvate, phosphate dikinase [Candidatus Brocadiaceae bacterium]|nr:pyruvate, phosphate dikinase [Candidatus Brocadiaceae bacterium]